MKTAKFTITGVSPLLMHNGRLADRRDPIVQEMARINAKKTKRTDSDYDRLSELEWQGGLWTDERGMPCIPPDAIIGCLIEGARKSRCGNDAESGVWCDEAATLQHDGPADLETLYANRRFVDYRGVGIKNSRVMRTRPRFPVWSASIELTFDESTTSESKIREWLETAGAKCGIGDFRPRFGRFVVE